MLRKATLTVLYWLLLAYAALYIHCVSDTYYIYDSALFRESGSSFPDVEKIFIKTFPFYSPKCCSEQF